MVLGDPSENSFSNALESKILTRGRLLDEADTFGDPRDGSSFVLDVELVDSVPAAAFS